MKATNFFKNNIFIIFFTIYFFIGLSIVQDYGISTDEEFQRYSGFYWLCYVLEILPFDNLRMHAVEKLNNIGGLTLPNPEDYPFYGVIFDLPLALIETILKIDDSNKYFLLRHKANFLIFFISSIFFFLILSSRFSSKKIIFIGILLYISSPRIFGDSFYNNKDLVFLSLVTITFYFYLKLIETHNYKNIFLFAFFSAITSSLRILGIFIPFSFLAFLLLQKINSKKKLFTITFYLTIFFSFLFLFWPYLWNNPVSNLIQSLIKFSKYSSQPLSMLFNGDYVFSYFLPLNYIPLWIFITTPIIILLLFFYGYLFCLKRFFIRAINIKEKSFYNDFWRSKNEHKDLFIFLNFNLIFFYIILSSPVLYTGWRHLYFLHPLMIYLGCYALYLIDLKYEKNKIIFFIVFILTLFNFYEIKIFHPYQSLYFNQLIQNDKKKEFEIDYWGLAGAKFLKEIVKIDKTEGEINIGVASYVPLERSLELLDDASRKKIKIIGQNYSDSDYIFHNNISEVNVAYNKKYDVPKNFKKIDDFSIKGFIVYEIYKKK